MHLKWFYKHNKCFGTKNWHDPCPISRSLHFMCTSLVKIELVGNLGHGCWARHRKWLGQLGQATEFGNSYILEPQ